mmetsp:Transcript_28160/g.45779  ORF Transcript_28160/g.45779 Transcript_28160/m.45779 type:complete len:88 (+) Transcript_28160:241-504(+)
MQRYNLTRSLKSTHRILDISTAKESVGKEAKFVTNRLLNGWREIQHIGGRPNQNIDPTKLPHQMKESKYLIENLIRSISVSVLFPTE